MLCSRLTYANVMATLAVVIALSGTTTAVAAVIVSSNSQVAKNTISGHAAPTGDHPNLIGGSVNATDLSASYKASVKLRCPVGMQLAAGSNICFDTVPRGTGSWQTAYASCYHANLRLPSPGELGQVFNNSGAPQDDNWADGIFDEGGTEYGLIVGMRDDRTIIPAYADEGTVLGYRCVTSATNE
jgi:hypothetical protein